jgi:hypothetical protein
VVCEVDRPHRVRGVREHRLSSHTAKAPVPSPNARTTVSCALPQKSVDEKNEAGQSAHSRLLQATTVFSSSRRDPHSRHTRMAGMMVLRCTWYALPNPSVSL